MSRQFDEYMSDKFELNGTMYQMVEPDSFDELMKAFEIRCNSNWYKPVNA